MLKNLDQLKTYTSSLAILEPSIADELCLVPGGVDESDLRSTGLELSQDYKSVATSLSLYGVSIGPISLWPTFDRNFGLIESLIRANQGRDKGSEIARNQGFVVVGRLEASPICLDERGGVHMVDIMSGDAPMQRSIASTFEILLLLAGNAHEIGLRREGDQASAEFEMRGCCKELGCTDEQTEFWVGMASEMAS